MSIWTVWTHIGAKCFARGVFKGEGLLGVMANSSPHIMSSVDDHALLASYAQNGNEDAFAELVKRYAPLVRAAARRQLADEHLAEDTAQSVMVTMMHKAGSIPRGAPLGPWLLRVTRHLAVDAMRSESTRRRHERLAAMERSEILAVALPDSWKSFESVLDQTLDAMSVDDRTVLTLRYLQGMGIEEVARELNLTPATTRQRISRAVRRMRALLSREKTRRGQELAILPIPLLEAQPARSFFERLLVNSTKWAKSATKFRRALAVGAAGVAIAGPIIIVLVLRHKPTASRAVNAPPGPAHVGGP